MTRNKFSTVARVYGTELRQSVSPQRRDLNLKPVYFSKTDEDYLAKLILQMQTQFYIRNWKMTAIEFK